MTHRVVGLWAVSVWPPTETAGIIYIEVRILILNSLVYLMCASIFNVSPAVGFIPRLRSLAFASKSRNCRRCEDNGAITWSMDLLINKIVVVLDLSRCFSCHDTKLCYTGPYGPGTAPYRGSTGEREVSVCV